MSGVSDVLREAHRLRRHLRELQTEAERVPRLTQARKALLAQQEDALKAAQDGLKKLKVAAHSKDTTLKATDQQLKKYERQLNEAGSPKEYEALQHEIATSKGKIAALEVEILDALTAIDEQTAKLPEAEAQTKKAREDFAAFETEQAARLDRLKAEGEKAKGELAGVEVNVPEKVRPLYDRLVTAYGADAFAALKDKTCGYCRTQVTNQRVLEITSGAFGVCNSCGRGLYVPA